MSCDVWQFHFSLWPSGQVNNVRNGLASTPGASKRLSFHLGGSPVRRLPEI